MSHPIPWSVGYWRRCPEWHEKSCPCIYDANGTLVLELPQNVGHPGEYDAVADMTANRIVQAVNASQSEEAGRNLAAIDRAADLPPVGASVRLTRDLDRSPAYTLHAGERGRVTETGPDVYAVEMDDPPHGLTVLGGEVLWFNEAEFLADIEPASLHDSADDAERRYLR